MKRIAVLLLAVLGIFALCSCGDKEEITTEKFQSYFEEKGFEVYDISDEWDEEIFAEYFIATNGEYNVEFLIFTEEEHAEQAMDGNEASYSVKTMSTEVTSGNYRTISFDSDGKHIMMTRVGKTMLFAEVDSEYKDEIAKHFDALGYK